MISYLTGTIKDVHPPKAVVVVNGVGYEVQCTERECAKLKPEKDVELYTHHYLREDSAELYGFSDKAERDMFKILIGISGVGPKGALNILNAAPLNILQRGIAEGDPSVLTKVSGIGGKIAQKVIVELQDKFGESWTELGGDIRGEGDVVEALQSLGYSRAQAQDVLKKLPGEVQGTENRVKEALKLLGR